MLVTSHPPRRESLAYLPTYLPKVPVPQTVLPWTRQFAVKGDLSMGQSKKECVRSKRWDLPGYHPPHPLEQAHEPTTAQPAYSVS